MAEVGIFVGTMYGNSLLVAEEAETILTYQRRDPGLVEQVSICAGCLQIPEY